jgi:hypothetical protein
LRGDGFSISGSEHAHEHFKRHPSSVFSTS